MPVYGKINIALLVHLERPAQSLQYINLPSIEFCVASKANVLIFS